MEKIKGMCAPYQFTLLKVSKSTLEFVRYFIAKRKKFIAEKLD